MKTIHHTYGPHVDQAYLRKTLLLSYLPWRYVRGRASLTLKAELKSRMKGEPFLFASGREALLALLRALKITSGEEVIVQGYTCVVVPNAIHAAGGSTIYADIDPATLNLTTETVEPLITPRTRAVICQHTFGIPAETRKLRELCNARGLILIEDMAHVLPEGKGSEGVGEFGDYLILSFGRDKAISGITGGAVIARHAEVSGRLLDIERTAPHLRFWNVAKILEYPTRMHSIVRPLSGTPFLKPLLALLNRCGMFVPIVTDEEKRGHMSPIVHKLPNVCAALALYSLRKLKSLNERRRTLTDFYRRKGVERGWPMLTGVTEGLPLQKFPLFVQNAQNIRSELKKRNIHLDDGWTGCVICPDSVEPFDAGYEWGRDPVAEAACMQILSLPTHPTMTVMQAERLTREIDRLLKVPHPVH